MQATQSLGLAYSGIVIHVLSVSILFQPQETYYEKIPVKTKETEPMSFKTLDKKVT